LLHYVSANGVEGYRQKAPKNVVKITETLLNAGAEIDATANVYGAGPEDIWSSFFVTTVQASKGRTSRSTQ
jgi:hypothetical protein